MTTVLITGASSGFGLAAARRFAEKGCRLILAARRIDRLKALQKDLNTDVLCIEMDVRNRPNVTRALGDLSDDWKRVDCLVNNAGLAVGLEPAWKVAPEDWETMIDTNIKGLTYVTRVILPGMVERKSGHVINIGSIAGNWPYPGSNTYGASKAFVSQFSQNLRADLHGTNVRVTNIEPGIAETEFSNVRFKGNNKKADAVYHNTRPLVADDIAKCIVWVFEQPAHVNINSMEVMPTDQTWGPLLINRTDKTSIS